MNEFDEKLLIFGICSSTNLPSANFHSSLFTSILAYRSCDSLPEKLSRASAEIAIAFVIDRRDLIARDPCEIRERKDSPGRSTFSSFPRYPFLFPVLKIFYSNTLSAASRILTIRKDRLQSLTSISILCQDGFLSCGRAIR